MSSATLNNQVTAAGKSFQNRRTLTTDGNVTKDPILAAAKGGTLTTRTDANTGTFTMETGHGFITGNLIDVYWASGARYGMTATVTGDSVVLDGGGGDDLPIATTVITAMKPQLEGFSVTTASLQGLLATCVSPAWAVFLDDVDAVVKAVYVGGSTDAYIWDAELVTTIEAVNPFSLGDVVNVYLSHGGAVARQVSVLALVN